MNSFKMQSGMKVGYSYTRVKNIDKVLEFYERDLGSQVNQRYQNENDSSVYEIGFKNALVLSNLVTLFYFRICHLSLPQSGTIFYDESYDHSYIVDSRKIMHFLWLYTLLLD